jgi:hypothetical protein
MYQDSLKISQTFLIVLDRLGVLIIMYGSSIPPVSPVVCRRAHVLFYVVCVCLRIVVSNAYCVVCFFVFFPRLVYPMLPVSLDCPFLISPSVFSDVINY